MKTVSESIFDGATKVIPMADVSHIEKHTMGITVVMKNDLRIFIGGKEGEDFLSSWCMYRHELEINTLKNISINNVSNEIGKNIVKNLKNNSKLT